MWEYTGQKFTKFFKVEFMNMVGIMMIRSVSIYQLVWSRYEKYAAVCKQPLKFADDFALYHLVYMLNTLEACDDIKTSVRKWNGFRHITPLKVEGRMMIASLRMLQRLLIYVHTHNGMSCL